MRSDGATQSGGYRCLGPSAYRQSEAAGMVVSLVLLMHRLRVQHRVTRCGKKSDKSSCRRDLRSLTRGVCQESGTRRVHESARLDDA
jgi:hypothetical protein